MRFRIAISILLLLGVMLVLAQPASAQQGSRAIVSKIQPMYPELARPLRLEGTVKVSVQVAPNGTVKSMKPLGGNPLLLKAAQDAVEKWRWSNAPQETSEMVELHFKPE